MLYISRIIVLSLLALIFGDVFSVPRTGHGDPAKNPLKFGRPIPKRIKVARRIPEWFKVARQTPEWFKVARQTPEWFKVARRIPKRFKFGEKVYKVERIQTTFDLEHNRYDNLYQVVPEKNHGQHILKFVQVQAKKFRSYTKNRSSEAVQSTLKVPTHFLAVHGLKYAMFKTDEEENFEYPAPNSLKATLYAATDHYFMVIELGNEATPGKPWTNPSDFVKLPRPTSTHFPFVSFSPILLVTPSDAKTTICDLERHRPMFLNELFKTSYLFNIIGTVPRKWHLNLQYEPTVHGNKEPREFMVYHVDDYGMIDLYEMKCRWTNESPEAVKHIIQPFVLSTLKIMQRHENEGPYYFAIWNGQPRFFYQPLVNDDSTYGVTLIEQVCTNIENGDIAIKHKYTNDEIFDINGLHTISSVYHYRCSDSAQIDLLPLKDHRRQTMSLGEFSEYLHSLCVPHFKLPELLKSLAKTGLGASQ